MINFLLHRLFAKLTKSSQKGVILVYMSGLEKNSEKNSQLVAFLSKTHSSASVTVLMKLAYLVDLVAVKKLGQPISEFEYRRYTFGPFDNRIYQNIKELVNSSTLLQTTDFSSVGSEYIVYPFNEEVDFSFELLSEAEKDIVASLVESVKGYGAKTLTEIAYQTKPMKAIGATLGGNEGLNVKLDLSLA